MSEDITYRLMIPEEAPDVSALVRVVFDEFIGPESTQQGIDEFHKFIEPAALNERILADHFIMIAVDKEVPVGMIEIRQNNHVSLLFVDRNFQNHGIAKTLLSQALLKAKKFESGLSRVTVNTSRQGVRTYEKLGFRQTGPEREVNGIIFIPMAKRLEP